LKLTTSLSYKIRGDISRDELKFNCTSIVSFIKDEKVKSCYRHIPKKYVGFTHVFYYCEVCDKKLSDGDEEPPGFNWNGLF
jgi:hypothetical protein